MQPYLRTYVRQVIQRVDAIYRLLHCAFRHHSEAVESAWPVFVDVKEWRCLIERTDRPQIGLR